MQAGCLRASTGSRTSFFVALLLVTPIGGCIANSSNPAVVMRSAQFNETSAAFDLQLSNPGGRDLVVTALEYSVSHGETSFPVARGAWSGSIELPSHGTATLALKTPFDAPLLEPDSDLLHLNGELLFSDRTGYLGIAAMDLTRTSFSGDIRAVRSTE